MWERNQTSNQISNQISDSQRQIVKMKSAHPFNTRQQMLEKIKTVENTSTTATDVNQWD
jgi:hypothetical protein